MSGYSAPIKKFSFRFLTLMISVGITKVSVSEDLVRNLEEAGKFAEQELFPLNATGDKQGVQFDGGKVTSPSGFKQAYHRYVEGGWPSLAQPESFGGQGLLLLGGGFKLWHSANQGWSMYSTLG